MNAMFLAMKIYAKYFKSMNEQKMKPIKIVRNLYGSNLWLNTEIYPREIKWMWPLISLLIPKRRYAEMLGEC